MTDSASNGGSPTRTLVTPVPGLAQGALFAGRYQIIEELGQGGMGRVYKAFDQVVGQNVALKLLRPEIVGQAAMIARFRSELKLARQITHRNVCRMYDLGQEGGELYITMELVTGEDLKSLIRRIGRVPWRKALGLARQIAAGLAEAHRLGIIHRDLKPQNIMIDKDGDAKIMDFGIARMAEAGGLTTQEGAIIGSPEYMSPEQADGSAADQGSDIYSLGAVIFEMLTGRLPFEGRTALDLALKHKAAAPPDPRAHDASIPAEVSRLVLKCLEKESRARYRSAVEVASELDRIEAALPEPSRPVARTRSRRVAVLAGLPVMAVLLALVLFVILPNERGRRRQAVGAKPDLLMVMPFENLFDPLDRGREARMTSNLVLTALSASGGLHVAGEQRLFDALKEIGREGERTIDQSLAAQLARRVGGTRMIMGQVSRLGERAILTSQIVQVRTGEILRSQRAEGTNLFAMADELSASILGDLGAPALATAKEPALTSLMTSSWDAYALYLQGLDRYYRYDYSGAEESFRKAIAIDPAFALAYWRLAWMQMRFGMGDMGAAAATAEIAYGFRQRLPEKERLYIEWLSSTFKMKIEDSLARLETLAKKYPEEKEAWFILAAGFGGPLMDPHRAILYHQKWLALDPGFKAGYLFLVRDFFNVDDLDMAAEYARKYIEIDPDDSTAHHMMGYVHYFRGELDRGMEEFSQALTLDPKYYAAVIGQAQILAKAGRLAESRNRLAPLLAATMKVEHRVGAYYQMGWNALAQDKWDEAEEYLKEMNRIILAGHLDLMSPFGHYALGWAYLTAGKLSEARREFEVNLEHNNPAWGIYGPATSHYLLGVVAIRMGQMDRARAEAKDLERMAAARDNQTLRAWHDDLIAKIQAGQKSGSTVEERRQKRPVFFLRAWWGWMTDIPGDIPL